MATGDFRNLPGNPIIYDPATGNVHGANKQQVSCNGVLNVICSSRIDPAAAAMVKLLQPDIANVFTTTNGLNNWVGNGTALFNRNDYDVKMNYVPSQKTTLFGRYSISNTLVFDPPLLGAAIGDATNGGQLGNAPGRIQSVGLGATHAFSPPLITSAANAHFGNTGRNQFVGPGYFSFNLGLIRDFRLWEWGTFPDTGRRNQFDQYASLR